jgi:hemerythrin
VAIVWTPELALGLPTLDEQHRQLFLHADRFHAALARADPADRLAEHLGFLAAYAGQHFDAEERFMREIGYPGLAAHVAEHGAFRRRLALLAPLEEQEGPSQAVLTLVGSLDENWLHEHVAGADMAYVRWWGHGRLDAMGEP